MYFELQNVKSKARKIVNLSVSDVTWEHWHKVYPTPLIYYAYNISDHIYLYIPNRNLQFHINVKAFMPVSQGYFGNTPEAPFTMFTNMD